MPRLDLRALLAASLFVVTAGSALAQEPTPVDQPPPPTDMQYYDGADGEVIEEPGLLEGAPGVEAPYCGRNYRCPDLFYNYYVPSDCGGVPAALYIAPHPVPAHVGHTYYTYQPFYPHEFLYAHKRSYTRFYTNGQPYGTGQTTTKVQWRGGFYR